MPNATLVPDAMSSLSTWLHYLEQKHPKAIDLGLERVAKVAEQLNVLKPAPYVFTVAGTNGKGTTCRTLEMILLAAGLSVGVYSSPHLLRYTERVRINNQESSEQAHVAAFTAITEACVGTSLTYFEYATLSALLQFKHANLDVVVLEVGLGGRLDATNIVDADIAVVTTIALDHIDYLGNTRESIGQEKAGIFKKNSIAVVGEPDAPNSILRVAKTVGCPIYLASPNANGSWSYHSHNDIQWDFCSLLVNYTDLPIPQVPLANAATAIAALSYSSLKIDKQAIITGLQQSELTGRFQKIAEQPLVILDVAHNPHAAAYLQQRLANLLTSKVKHGKVRMVIGMLKDKDITETIKILHADSWYCASLSGARGSSAQALYAHLGDRKADAQCFATVSEAWQQAQLDAQSNDIILVCGSFYTVAEVLSIYNHE